MALAEPRPPLRLGVLAPAGEMAAWQARCLEQLLATEGLRPTFLLLTDARREGWLPRLYRRILARVPALRPVDGAEALGTFPALGRVGREGDRLVLDPEAALEVRAANLDLVVKLVPDRLGRGFHRLAREGIWELRVGEGAGLPLLHELDRGSVAAPVRLVRLVPERQAEEVIRESFLPIEPNKWAPSVERLLMAASEWPSHACRSHAVRERAPMRPCMSAPSPSLGDWFRLETRVARNRLRKLGRVGRLVHWNVGVVDAPIQRFLEPDFRPDVRWLPEQRGRFMADPSGLPVGRGLLLAVEDFDQRAGTACISAVVSRDGRGFGEPEPVIEMPVHMSYPYLLQEDGKLYCMPETSAAGEVALWEVRHRGPWHRVSTLITGFPAVDATVFRHQGRWWLLASRGGGFEDFELHGWHAPSLRGPWTSHGGNPLVVDACGGRPAGTPFVHRGELFRPGQDCSGGYGGAVVLFRVLALSPSDYREERVRLVEPDPEGPYPEGLHTLCAAGNRTLVDGYRLVGLDEDPLRVIGVRATSAWNTWVRGL